MHWMKLQETYPHCLSIPSKHSFCITCVIKHTNADSNSFLSEQSPARGLHSLRIEDRGEYSTGCGHLIGIAALSDLTAGSYAEGVNGSGWLYLKEEAVLQYSCISKIKRTRKSEKVLSLLSKMM